MNIKCRHVLVLLLLADLMCIQAPAETIISVASINLFGGVQIFSGQGYRVGWTQTYSYAGVTVAAQLSGEFGLTGQAYLTTRIGPGTTTANQIASTTFSIPGGSTLMTLFQGLSLPPGSYYLCIIGDSPSVAFQWDTGSATNSTTDTGVIYLGSFGVPGGNVSSYFPASPVYLNSPIPDAEFSVEGTLVDHPRLEIVQTGSTMLVYWTTNSPGFILESSGTLNSTNWPKVAQQPVIISDQYVVAVSGADAQFFRLSKATP